MQPEIVDGEYYVSLYPTLRWMARGIWRGLTGKGLGVTIKITPKGYAVASFDGLITAAIVPPVDALYCAAPRALHPKDVVR